MAGESLGHGRILLLLLGEDNMLIDVILFVYLSFRMCNIDLHSPLTFHPRMHGGLSICCPAYSLLFLLSTLHKSFVALGLRT